MPTKSSTKLSVNAKVAIGVTIVVIGAVFVVLALTQKKNSNGSTGQATTVAQAPAVGNFYDCWDNLASTNTDSTATCINNGKTYTRPTAFTEDSVRNFSKVPASAKNSVLSLSQQKFDACTKSDPKAVATTHVQGANDRLVYLTSTCADSQASLLVGDGGVWKEVALPQGVLSCEIADQYHIPKEVVYDASNAKTPGTATCITADGHQRALE